MTAELPQWSTVLCPDMDLEVARWSTGSSWHEVEEVLLRVLLTTNLMLLVCTNIIETGLDIPNAEYESSSIMHIQVWTQLIYV